jgi:CTD nuclear envelope phosphatase 1
VNEAGEPIYEIREDAEGHSLAPLPEGSGEGAIEMPENERPDYFSNEAVERRAALRRRIFHEGDDSDDEGMDVDKEEAKEAKDDMDVDDAETPKASRPAGALPTPAQAPPQTSPQPSFQSTLQAVQLDHITSPTTPTQPSIPSFPTSPARGPPKGILKQPMRKKSVSFDDSVPMPPDSPPPRRHGFPLDQMIASTRPVDAQGMPTKQVPILNAPIPGRRKQPETFGGLRTGFLSSAPILSLAPQVESGRTAMTQPEPRQPSPLELQRKAEEKAPAKLKVEEKPVEEKPAVAMQVEEKPAAPVKHEKANKEEMDVDEPPAKVQKTGEAADDKPKKKSLFAQRRTPNFPKQSDTAPMVTMKGSVVEAPPAPRQTGVPPTVGSSQAPMVIVDDDEDDDEDYGDLGEFSDDEEDEYALDEALLAREVALEYHRRQQWQRPIDEDDFDPEAEGAEAVLGIPRVSTISGQGEDLRIVNPTADDLSQFLRVGRADDGELVFEQPLVNSDSESDGEDASSDAVERRQRRARRKDVMARLMRGEYEELPTQPAAAPGLRAEQYTESLPPTVGAVLPEPKIEEIDPSTPATTAPTSTPAPPKQPPATRDVVERTAPEAPSAPSAPKKLSRFKAARMQS